MNISFFIPVYNGERFIEESVDSIMQGNFQGGDELVIVNDGSTDGTAEVLDSLKIKYPEIKIIHHIRNKGGACARNTAVENTKHQILFCLDADNILVRGSIEKLKSFMESNGADVVAFEKMYRFNNKDISKIIAVWSFTLKPISLEYYLSGEQVPGHGGNYMFTRESWQRAGGYPEENWLDTWGFGLRQIAMGCKMMAMPDSYYYHRCHSQSYYQRESKKQNISLTALIVLIPFLHLIKEEDVNYIMGPFGRYVWFERLDKHPLKLTKKPKSNFMKDFSHPDLMIKYVKEFSKKKLPYLVAVYRNIKNKLM